MPLVGIGTQRLLFPLMNGKQDPLKTLSGGGGAFWADVHSVLEKWVAPLILIYIAVKINVYS